MPSVGKAAKAAHTSCRLKDSLHSFMIASPRSLCKTMALRAHRDYPSDGTCASFTTMRDVKRSSIQERSERIVRLPRIRAHDVPHAQNLAYGWSGRGEQSYGASLLAFANRCVANWWGAMHALKDEQLIAVLMITTALVVIVPLICFVTPIGPPSC